MTDMAGAPEREGTAASENAAASDRHHGETRQALEQAAGAIASERRDARDTQDRTDAQRRDARDAQDLIDAKADTQRQDARDAQDLAEAAQDSDRQDALDSFDARRDEERHDAFEQNVADHQRADDLELSNQNLEAFAYLISHGLRAPLQIMSGFSTVLLEDYASSLSAEGRGHAEKIHAASRQMGQFIDDLMLLARLSRVEVCLEPVDLGAEAAAIAADLQATEPQRRVIFTIQQPAWAMADRSLIRTVLQNLLGNAWKFTSGQDNAQIELGTTPDEDTCIRCYVRDNGVGFDPAQASKLFGGFQRLLPAGQFPGPGIGLASVRQIVERHGGRVHASGATGEGATFSFTLAAMNPAP